MDGRSYRYQLVDLQEMTSEDLELTVEINLGDTVRTGSGRLAIVVAVVKVEDEAPYAGVLIVEPLSE
ncbi:MAG: hypothetical protein ACXVRS_03885 [Gaiellaceae bacterium]